MRRILARESWSWMIAVVCCLPLSGGCTPPDAADLAQFATDLLLNAVAAFLL